MARGYGQYCGLARALELVGGRWSLLIVRELLVGPKRYTELVQALPGIPTNVLSSRLRELEDAELVERALQARPSTAVVYSLTAYGRELEEPIVSLGMWGAKALGPPTPDLSYSRAALAVALRGTFNRDATRGRGLRTEIRFDEGSWLHVDVSDGDLSFPPEPSSEPKVVLDTTPDVFSALFRAHVDVDAAVASGQLRVEGSMRDARRFFEVFHLPSA